MYEPTPSAWSTHNPDLQVAWDSSSLQAVMFCPRHYEYAIRDGRGSGDGVDLAFGGYAATGFETYQKARLEGLTKERALLRTVRAILTLTWRDGDQWGGAYEEQWHCTGTEPYKNSKGNRAKCPYAHKGVWLPPPNPGDTCGVCGSPIETARNYSPDNKAKNRQTLLRTLVWYIDEQPEEMEDGLHPYQFPDGTPAVELSIRLPLPFSTPYGETYILAAHLDYIGVFGGDILPVDNKTTTKSLNDRFWSGYNPSMQLDTYDMMVNVLYPDLHTAGVLVDAAQVLQSTSNFARRTFYKTEGQRQEQWETIEFWIKQAERYAEAHHWPMNKRSCWLCPFNQICRMDPEVRQVYLDQSFPKRDRWNPLLER